VKKLNKSLPVFANTRPWNELILLGKRKFKTIGFPWKYRGDIYLYDTKGTPADYGFDWAEDFGVRLNQKQAAGHPSCIVGIVEIYDCRSFTDQNEEADHEILLRNPVRFKSPIPFSWPSGAIRIARIK